jgi:hypothetical protein
MGRRWFRMTMREFARALGLYTEIDLQAEIFTRSRMDHTAGDCEAAWGRLASGTYHRRTQKSTSFYDPLHRYLHCVIVHTLGGMGETTEGVTSRDIFHVSCLV